MKKNYFITIVTLLSTFSLLAQDPQIDWQNAIGGDGPDEFWAMDRADDGGYFIASGSWSGISGDKTEPLLGVLDYWIIKTDATGTIQWQNTLGGIDGDRPRDIVATSDGGCIVGGYSSSPVSPDKSEPAINGTRDYWVVKLDNTGAVEWENTIGGDNFDLLISLDQTNDGGYILGGFSASGISGDKTEPVMGERDYWVVKLNAAGAVVWDNTIGGDRADWLRSVVETPDGGFLLGGYSDSDISGDKTEDAIGALDYWVVKLDSSGAVQWDNTIGGTGVEELWDVSLTSDGGSVLIGNSDSNISGDKTEDAVGGTDYWVVKLDATGTISWQNTIGGTDNDWPKSIVEVGEGRLLLGGWSYSNASGDKTENSLGGADYWTLIIDGAGNIRNQNTIGGDDNDFLFTALQNPDESVVIGGQSQSGMSGDKEEALIGPIDLWIVSLNAFLGIDDVNLSNGFQIYPNPVAATLSFSLEAESLEGVAIYNSLGQAIQKISKKKLGSRAIDVSGLSSGVYFIQITSEGKTATKKFLKE